MEQFPTPENQELNPIETLKAEIAQKKLENKEAIEEISQIVKLLDNIERMEGAFNTQEKIAA